MSAKSNLIDLTKYRQSKLGTEAVADELAKAAQAASAGDLKNYLLVWTGKDGRLDYTLGWTDAPTISDMLRVAGVLSMAKRRLLSVVDKNFE